jgi:5-methylcytosine-specific restriction endonuclease McrA
MDNNWELFREYIPILHNVCLRCDYKWIPKRADTSSSVCPRCNTPLWKQPRVFTRCFTRLGDTLTREQWDLIIKNQDYKCSVCKEPFTFEKPPVRDHIIPLTEHGRLTLDNTQALCLSCNSKKTNKIYMGMGNKWRGEQQ